METQTLEKSTQAATYPKTNKTKIFAIVQVDDTFDGSAGTRIFTASLYSEMSTFLAAKGVVEIVSIIRGREIPFKEQKKIKFF